jgi:hypothetical protein
MIVENYIEIRERGSKREWEKERAKSAEISHLT